LARRHCAPCGAAGCGRRAGLRSALGRAARGRRGRHRRHQRALRRGRGRSCPRAGPATAAVRHADEPDRPNPDPHGAQVSTTTRTEPVASGTRPHQGGVPTLTTTRGAFAGRLFHGVTTLSGAVILLILAAVAVFLLLRAWPALTAGGRTLAEEI